MKLFDLVTFKALNKINKQDEANALNVWFAKEGSLEYFKLFSWTDYMGSKAYVVESYKYGIGSFYSRDYDTLQDALNFITNTIATKFAMIEECLYGPVSYINDSSKHTKALEIKY